MATLQSAYGPASVLYNRHHINCIQCIAGGRGMRYGKRCPVGLDLWNLYQTTVAAPVSGGASEARDADGAEEQSIPDGNHGDNLRSVQK